MIFRVQIAFDVIWRNKNKCTNLASIVLDLNNGTMEGKNEGPHVIPFYLFFFGGLDATFTWSSVELWHTGLPGKFDLQVLHEKKLCLSFCRFFFFK